MSSYHSIIEYNNRFFQDIVNYFTESSKSTKTNRYTFESLGDLRLIKSENDSFLHAIWMLENNYISFLSKSKKSGMLFLKMRLNNYKQDEYYNVNHILYIDCKKYN